MVRKLSKGLIYNLDFVEDDETHAIISMKCEVCGKFIARDYTKWYCPHCSTTFLEGVSTEAIIEMDTLLKLIESMK